MEGVLILPDTERRKVKVGSMLSRSSVQRDEHDCKTSRNEQFQKDSEDLKVTSITKVGWMSACLRWERTETGYAL